MKKVAIFLSCLLLIAVSLAPAASAIEIGTSYYVDSVNGADSNSGSESHPWKTVTKACEMTYGKGDKILFAAGGYYQGTFTAKGNGTAENPITVSSYGDITKLGKPILVSTSDAEVMMLINVNGWRVENFDISAPDGKGITVTASGMIMTDITIQNCDFHDVYYKQCTGYRGQMSPIFINATGVDTRIENLTVRDVNIRDCAYGIQMSGNTVEWGYDTFVSPEVSYSQNFLFENITMNNILYDGIVICSINNLLIRNCAVIRASQNTDYYTAPVWMHHAKGVTIENCEIAGAKNYLDGMAVDFDGWSTDCTYQYVYSHDNILFMRNCVYDGTTANRNCTVRYCLSVNDSQHINSSQLCSSSSYRDCKTNAAKFMENLKFYNNTIINTAGFDFSTDADSTIVNNIFIGKSGAVQPMYMFTSSHDSAPSGKLINFSGTFSNNCYYNTAVPFEDKAAKVCDPVFTGNDLTNKDSFILSGSSPLIGKGISINGEDMGTHDLYGNAVDSNTIHNIGCYEGSGTNDGQHSGIIKNIKNGFNASMAVIGGKIADLVNIFKLFVDRTADLFRGDLSKQAYSGVMKELINKAVHVFIK